ncbi:hypothetical protein ACGFNX_24635 [Streptomyces sp. NPDC048723]|uniref:hypothetical protein n=1 Tax=Streptomyces sp. NPDC048723 TaxID=3365589 RepID=UPI003715CB84
MALGDGQGERDAAGFAPRRRRLTLFAAGSWVALNIRGAAASLERRAAANAELAMHPRGDLGPPRRVASAGF